jgi:hypothetical protein
MRYGIKFCGGCNPRYERSRALKQIQDSLSASVDFEIAKEDASYDGLLVISGCSNCCPEIKTYKVRTKPLKMWDEKHIDKIMDEIKKEVDVT